MSGTDSKNNDHYSYSPSLAAAIIFVACFSATSIYHMFQILRLRSWFFTPFLVGCFLEVAGYAGRLISATQTTGEWTLVPYIVQALLLLLGPPFYAVSIYMILGRLTRLLDGEKLSLVKVTWLTKLFLFGDVISILAQARGGGMLSSAETKNESDRGQMVILIGLGIQIVFFSLFIAATGLFHCRIHRAPTNKSRKTTAPWGRLLGVLYGASLLILVRSIFRVAEYALGDDGELVSKEVYLYVFDAVPMLIASIVFNILHPAEVIGKDLPVDRLESGAQCAFDVHLMDTQASR